MRRLFVFLPLLTLASINNPSYVDKPLKFFAIESLNLTKKPSRIVVQFNSSVSRDSVVDVFLINDKYANGIKIFSTTKNSHSGKLYGTYNNEYTRPTNSIRIDVSQNGKLTTETTTLVVSKSKTFTITSNNNVFSSPQNTIYFDENGWSSAPEKYTFINFDGMYAPNYYHGINVLDFKISKEGIFPISSDNTHLMISNWNGVFDEMPLTGKYLDVPLIFNPSGDLIVRDTYYVDPLTLRMSKNPKSGYIATRHIYFPKNEMKYQGEYEGRLLFNDLGQDHNVYAYKFTFNALMNIMGDCQSSEYCIVASAKERK